MANMSRGKSLGNDLRGGLVRYFKIVQSETGMSVSDIWAKLFQEDPVQAMRLAISLTPKEVEMEQTINGSVDVNTNQLQDQVMEQLFKAKREERSAETLQ